MRPQPLLRKVESETTLPGRNHMFLLGIGLGRSKGLMRLKGHIFQGNNGLDPHLSGCTRQATATPDLLKAAYAGDLEQQVRGSLAGKRCGYRPPIQEWFRTALLQASRLRARLARAEIVQGNKGFTALAKGAEIVQPPKVHEIDIQQKDGGTALFIASASTGTRRSCKPCWPGAPRSTTKTRTGFDSLDGSV